MASAVKNMKLPPYQQEQTFQEKVDAWKLKQYGKDQNWVSLHDLGADLAQYREKKRALEEQIAEINLRMEALNQMLVEKMTAEDLQNFKLGSGWLIYLSYELYPAVKDKQQLLAWIRQHKMQSQLALPWQTLKGLVNDLSSEGKALPAGVEAYMKTQARVRSS